MADHSLSDLSKPVPGSSAPVRRAVGRIVRPVEAFLATEVSSGIVLLAATVIALAWANSPWGHTYEAFWEARTEISIGSLAYVQPLRFWVDEVLMTIFFFVVGLEIRREIARGELSEPSRAALPLAAALGGMIIPASIYLALNAGRPTASGWGVPMATDIAFALGVLALLGKRVPPALRILLLALAVIDDVGAILVIGLFYSAEIHPLAFTLAAAGATIIVLMQRAGIRSAWLYVPPGALVWEGIHDAGVHATLAGVIVGMMTPTASWLGREGAIGVVERVIDQIRHVGVRAEAEVAHHLDALADARREALAPVDYLQHRLHRWVAFGVMPLFALANAGVTIGALEIERSLTPLWIGITVGLVLGKPLGIVGGAFIATRLGLGKLPTACDWKGVIVVGLAGGIGFTMSLFIANLAFHGPALEVSKLAILLGSLLAAVLGIMFGRMVLPVPAIEVGAATETEAERSTQH